MTTEEIKTYLEEIESKAYQMRGIVDGLIGLGLTLCKNGDSSSICFTGTDPEATFTNLGRLAGELQEQIDERVTTLFKNA